MTFSTLDSLKLVDLVGFANLSTKNRCSELFCSDKSLISKTFFWKIRGKKSDPFLEKNTWCLVEKSLQDQISKSISETCWFSALLNWRFACLFQTYAQNLVWDIISHTLSPNKKWIGDSITKSAVPTGCQQKMLENKGNKQKRILESFLLANDFKLAISCYILLTLRFFDPQINLKQPLPFQLPFSELSWQYSSPAVAPSILKKLCPTVSTPGLIHLQRLKRWWGQ